MLTLSMGESKESPVLQAIDDVTWASTSIHIKANQLHMCNTFITTVTILVFKYHN